MRSSAGHSFLVGLEKKLANWHSRQPIQYDAEDAERIARELGLSVSELSEIVAYGSERPDLLRHRMTLLGLDPDNVAAFEAALVRELQIRCAQCDSRRQCLLDFARTSNDPYWAGWREYCPNAATLNMLSTLQICSQSAPEF